MLHDKLNPRSKIIIFLSGVMLLAQALAFAAGEEQQVKREVITRQVTGEIGGITKNFISVIYGQNEKESFELALLMDKDTRGSQRKLSEIKVGDIVLVTYQEVVETRKGEKPRVIKRLAKVVEFRRQAEVIPEDNVLESQ